MLVALLLACRGAVLVAEPDALRIEAEPGVDAEGAFELHNDGGDVIVVSSMTFVPDDVPATWGGDGPWTLSPGGVADARVLFRPEEVGEWDATLVIGSTAGEVTVGLELVSQPSVDDDGDGWSPAGGDCDDADEDAFPGHFELCDGADNDCNGAVDDGFDHDGDGHLTMVDCENGLGDDCDDDDPTIHPGHVEDCDLADSDCNGVVDDTTEPSDLQLGVCAGSLKVCADGATEEPDYLAIDAYEAVEVSCDGLDNDCDGDADHFDHSGDLTDDCTDDDRDGAAEVDGDCDDADAAVLPEHCGASHLVVTSTSDGFSTVDLNLRGAARHVSGRELYDVAVQDADDIWLTDRVGRVFLGDPTSDHLDQLSWDSPPWGVVHHAGLGQVWVASEDGVIQALDDATLATEVSVQASGAAIGLAIDGDTVWACAQDGYLYKIDAATGVTDRVHVVEACFGAPIVDAARGRVLVLGYVELEIAVVDRAGLTLVDRFPLADRAIRGQLASDGLWLAGGVDGVVTRLDPDTLAVLDTFPLGEQVQDVWRDEVRDELWATLVADDAIVRVDPTSGAILDTVPATAPLLMEPVPP
jgi:hypothetical protein